MKIYQVIEIGLRKIVYEMGMKRYIIMQALLITFILSVMSIFKTTDLFLIILGSFVGGMSNIWMQFAFFNLFVKNGRVSGRKTLKW